MQYTITLTLTTNDKERWEAEAAAQVLVENAQARWGGHFTSIESKVIPVTRETPVYPGERHPDCGQMVPYGGALLHQCK